MKKLFLSVLIALSFAVCCSGTFLLAGCENDNEIRASYTISVTFNANGGTIAASSNWTGSGSYVSKSYNYDSDIEINSVDDVVEEKKIIKPPVAEIPTYGTIPTASEITKTNCTFMGWFTAKTGGTQITSTSSVTPTRTPYSVYAQWTENTTTPSDVDDYADPSYSYMDVNNMSSILFCGNGGIFVDSSGYLLYSASGRTNYQKADDTTTSLLTVNGESNKFFKTSSGTTDFAYVAGLLDYSRGYVMPILVSDVSSEVSYKYLSSGSTISYSGSFSYYNKNYYYSGYSTSINSLDPYIYNNRDYNLRQIIKRHDGTNTSTTLANAARLLLQSCLISPIGSSKLTDLVVTPRNDGKVLKDWTIYYKFSTSYWKEIGKLSDLSSYTFSDLRQLAGAGSWGHFAFLANWATTYTVSYNANGGTGAPATSTFAEGMSYRLSADKPTKTGYTFTGWSLGAAGGTLYENYALIPASMATSNHVWYANWTPNTYTLRFEGNGNTGGSMSDISATYDAWARVTTNAFTKTGYTFSGWKASGLGSNAKIWKNSTTTDLTSSTIIHDYAEIKNCTDIAYGTVTLTAQWTATSYILTMDANGGSGTSIKSVTYNNTYGTLITPTRPGYTFTGWKTSLLQNNEITYTRTDTSWTTGWSIGLSLKNAGINLTDGQTYKFAFDIKTTGGSEEIPWSSNTLFVNANTSSSLYCLSTGKVATSSGNITSTARRYYAEFVYRADSTSVYKNDPIHIYPNYTGKTTQTMVSNIELVGATQGYVTESSTVNILCNHSLYAQWSANSYTLTFDANGGTGTTTKTITHGSTIGELPVPTRKGYTFAGWAGNMFSNYRPNIVGTTEYCILGTDTNQNLEDYVDYTLIIKYKRPTNTSGTVDIYGDGGWLGLGNAPASDTLRIYTYHFNAGKASAWTHGAADYIQFFNIPSQNNQNSPADLIEIAIYKMKIDGNATLSAYVCDEDILTAVSISRMTENATVFASWVPNSYTVNFDTNGGNFVNSQMPINSNLNNWTKASGFESTFKKVAYSDRKNTVVVNGSTDGWEHIYKTFSLTAGYTYTFSSYYNIPTALTYENTGYTETKGMRMQLFSGSVPPNQGEGHVAQCNFGYEAGSGTKSLTYNCTTSGTYCLSYNFGWVGDGADVKLEVGDIMLTTNDPNFKSTIAVTYDESYGSLPTPRRDNYEFMGWSGAASVPDFSEWTLSNGATYDASTGILTLDGETASASSPLIDVGEISSFYFYIYAMCNSNNELYTGVTYYSDPNTNYSGNGWSENYTSQGVDVGKWGWVRTMNGATEQIKSGTCRYVRVSISRDPTYAPQTYYVKKCMIGTTDDYPKTYAASTTKVTTPANHILVADWKPIARNVTVRVMSSSDSDPNTYKESIDGMLSVGYDYYNTPTNGSEPVLTTGSLSAAYTSLSVASGTKLTFYSTEFAKSGYVFLGVNMNNAAPSRTTKFTATSSAGTVSADTTIYLWFKKVSSNQLKYDEEEKYWYFEDGKTLQSYVGDELNATLNNNIDKTTGSTESVVYYKNGAEQQVGLYNYNNETYGWLKATKDYTMISKTLKFTNKHSASNANVTIASNGLSCTVEAPVVSGNTYLDSYVQMYDGSNYPSAKLVSNDGTRKCYEFTKTANLQWVRLKYNGTTTDSTLFITDMLENGHTYRLSYNENFVSGATSGKAYNVTLTEVYNFEKDQTYWFKYEPIRWRVSSYGVEKDDLLFCNAYWKDYGSFNKSFMYVSDKIVFASQMTSGQYDLSEGKSYIDTKPNELGDGGYSMNKMILTNTFDYLQTLDATYTKFGSRSSGSDRITETASFKVRVASVEELQTNFSDLRAKPTDYVAFLLGVNADQYCNYFTRDVGKKYYNMTGIGVDGRVHDYYTNNFMGMRLAMNFSEGSRY